MPIPKQLGGKQRVVIEHISPEIDGGRFAAKSTTGDLVTVEADIFLDGHDKLSARLLYRHQTEKKWSEAFMRPVGNDHFTGEFRTEKTGFYFYTIEAWVDHPLSWQHEIGLKIQDGQFVNVELLVGANFLDEMAKQATSDDKVWITGGATLFRDTARYQDALQLAQSFRMLEWIHRYPLRHNKTVCGKELKMWVDRERAAFSTWYSLFPRSTAKLPSQHGTFETTAALLPRLADMGFDVLYIPPIHPIGNQFRKGKNNTLNPTPTDPGVPYAIGSELGGYDAIHPELGTLADFKKLIAKADEYGIEIAMDLAIQCSPDHPWVKEHPTWFKIKPDGTIQYAENPPKKYQDIYPINFESEDWRELWEELRRIIFLWAEWGVKIIRVDNPHTKAFGFWEWVIAETLAVYPDMIFLAEAFTKPRVMQQLAKLGYAQSYTYYVWRTNKAELTEYLTELTQTEMRHYFRPNFWPNTHDINPMMLQSGNETLFLIRYFMAATLSANYGIFGPVYEYMEHAPYPGKEEYLNSEKYEIRHWNWQHENTLTRLILSVNRIRKENSALQRTNNITFCGVNNDQILAYLKTHENGNRILCVVNLDPANTQNGGLRIPLPLISKRSDESYRVRDLLTGQVWYWQGEENFVELNPQISSFHLFRIEDNY